MSSSPTVDFRSSANDRSGQADAMIRGSPTMYGWKLCAASGSPVSYATVWVSVPEDVKLYRPIAGDPILLNPT